MCEHYLTFFKSLLPVILCLLSKKTSLKSKKNEEFLTKERGNLENAKGCKHESMFTFKMAFLECFQTGFFLLFFYHKQSRALFCSQGKVVTQLILVLDISRTVSKLRSRVNLQVHFKFAFGILFSSTRRVFPKNIQT